MSQVAKRYSRALFNISKGDLAKAKRQLEVLGVVKELFEGKAAGDAGKILRSPAMPPDLKKALLDYGLDQAKADDDTRHLLSAVTNGGRISLIPEMHRAFAELIDEAEGVARAQVTAASALNAAESAEIGQTLGKLLNKKVTVDAAVDPSLLGGFVAQVGNYKIDLSLKTKLEGLAESAVQDTSL